MAKSNEPIWWSLFFAGAGVGAMFVPALIFITGIALPFVNMKMVQSVNPVPTSRLYTLTDSWPGAIFLFLVISLSLFHWAHRFRYTLADLGVHCCPGLIAVLCYGSAITGTAVTGYLTFIL